MKTRFKRLMLTYIVMIIVALSISSIAVAATYIITESTLFYVYGPQTYPINLASGGCAGGYCRYLYQSENLSVYRWDHTEDNVDDWEAYCPTIGEAAARYTVRVEGQTHWSIIMNQANQNHQGSYVYLGDSNNPDNSGGYLTLQNSCVAGYWCGGLKVYWDNMRYTTQ